MPIRYRVQSGNYEENHVFSIVFDPIDPNKDLENMRDKGMMCTYLEADGSELRLIRDRFSNIPIVNNSVLIGRCQWRRCRWKGDIAAFIAMNLFF